MVSNLTCFALNSSAVLPTCAHSGWVYVTQGTTSCSYLKTGIRSTAFTAAVFAMFSATCVNFINVVISPAAKMCLTFVRQERSTGMPPFSTFTPAFSSLSGSRLGFRPTAMRRASACMVLSGPDWGPTDSS